MTFEEAVAELKSPGENGKEGYIRRATAVATYYAHTALRTDHPVPPSATTTRDKAKPMKKTRGEDVHAAVDRIARVWGVTKRTGDSQRGPDWARVLDAAQNRRTTDAAAPVATPADFQAFARDKERKEQRAMRTIAQRTKAFWSRQTANG